MQIKVNERTVDFASGKNLGNVKKAFKSDADVLILNGFPCPESHPVSDGDEIILIKRGETPSEAELEALMASRHTPGVHKIVKKSHVGIAGLGGLGSQAAIALARIGVGRLTIADFDVVEPSNLNRQQYFIDQIGLPKADALSATLKRINPYVEVQAHRVMLEPGNIETVFRGCDALVEAFDKADQKAMLVRTALSVLPNVWLVAASGLAGYGEAGTIKVRKMGERLFIVGDLESAARPGVGLMAPRVGVAANIQANLVLRLLLGEKG